MKKIYIVFALACAVLMIACKGESKPKEEASESVTIRAKKFADELISCGDDTLKQKEVLESMELYSGGLSEPECKRFNRMVDEYVNNSLRQSGLYTVKGDSTAIEIAF